MSLFLGGIFAIRQKETRWGSTYTMLKRYLEILPRLRDCRFSAATQQLFLFEHENDQIQELIPALEEFERTSKWLQSKDGKFGESFFPVNLYYTRKLFDSLIQQYPATQRHLQANADIVHRPQFENAVCKLQGGCTLAELNDQERHAVEVFFPIEAAIQPLQHSQVHGGGIAAALAAAQDV